LDPVTDRPNLAATLDGVSLSDDEAKALWTRFSQYMEEHRGDTAGFAKQNGYVSVTPTFAGGRAVLVARTTEAPPAPPPAPARGGGQKKRARGKRRR
jgi:hypothetical protein